MSVGRALIIVENAPVPLDARVWPEASVLRDAGYEVTVISPALHGHVAAHEILDGIEIFRHPLPRVTETPTGYAAEYAVALWHELRLMRHAWRVQGFDVVQICNPPDLLFLVAGWAKFVLGVPVIFDHHDLSSELYVVKFSRRGLTYRLLRLLERLTYATADVVVATNESYAQIAMQRGRKAAEDVFVVRNAPMEGGLESDRADPSLRRSRKHLVAFVGWMAEQDGLDGLVDTIAHVVHGCGRRDVQFLLIGDGPVRQNKQAECKRRGLEDHVDWPGFVSGERLRQMIASVDVYLCPEPKNAYNDASTMIKVVEAMAWGKPVVQFDVREGRRSAGDAALYATANRPEDLGDQLLRVLDDDELRARMGAMGRARFDELLSWDVQGPRLLAAYERARAKR